jgi:hypothetical protein
MLLGMQVLKSLENPFGPKVLPMSSVRRVTHVSGLDNLRGGAPGGIRTPDPLLRRQTLFPTELRAHPFLTSLLYYDFHRVFDFDRISWNIWNNRGLR